jgi:mannose-1-phosphate guanylyltransferase/phosphomannomutase
MLAEKRPLRAFAVDGYWSDVGTLEQYKIANEDALYGRVRLDLPGVELTPGIRCGEGCTIHANAVLQAPLVLGNGVIVESGATIAGSAVGDNAVIHSNALTTGAVLWKNVYVGARASVRDCVIADATRICSRASIADGAVLGAACSIGSNATISRQITIWPHREVAKGATVSMSMVHRLAWPRSLFGDDGVRGVANIEVDSPFAARLGEAFGSTLERGNTVIVGGDSSKSSRVVAASIITGLLSVGIDVMSTLPIEAPIVRAAVRSSGQGGLYVRVDPADASALLIEFIDAKGMNASRALQRKIEGIFARGEFRRVSVEEIGTLCESREKPFTLYSQQIASAIPRGHSFERNGFRLIVNAMSTRLENVLSEAFQAAELHVNFVKANSVERIASAVREHRASCGMHFDEAGEKLTLIDERGVAVSSEDLLTLCSLLVSGASPNARIAVPPAASGAIDAIAKRFGASVLRTSSSPSVASAFVASAEPKLQLASYDALSPVFPEFSPIADAFYASIRLADLLSKTRGSVHELVASMPAVGRARRSVPCTRGQKLGIMRLLQRSYPGAESATTGGVRVRADRAWALVLPDAVEASFTVFGEAETSTEAHALVDEVAKHIADLSAA